MPAFVFIYRAPEGYQAATPEASARWTAWFQGMGPGLADLGRPVGESAAVGHCGDGQSLQGYSVINSDDLDGALAIAKGCPLVDAGGGVEVGALLDLPPALAS